MRFLRFPTSRSVALALPVDDEMGRGSGLGGRPCNLVFGTLDADGQRSQPFRTLFLQELISRGIIGPSFVVSAALSDEDIDRTVAAVDLALGVYARALGDGIDGHLRGRPVKPVFRPFV